MPVTKDKIKGLLFLIVTIVGWVGSATLIKEIFTSIDYPKPFFVTYVSDSMNFLYIITMLRRCRKRVPDSVPMNEVYVAKDYVMLALKISPLVFVANYLYNEGLTMTSIASCTILSNTSSIFIFLISMPLLHAEFSIVKCLCVLVSFGGACLISMSDNSGSGGQSTLVGDVVSLISAVMYAFYATMLKRWVPEDSKFSWSVLFTLLGVCVAVMGIPITIFLHLTGIETFMWPPFATFMYLVLNGICGTVFPDYFWARSVVLLDPLISDLGIGITIPLGMIIDYFVEGNRYSFFYVLGALYIMGAFVVITLYDFKQAQREQQQKSLDKEAGTESLLSASSESRPEEIN